MSVIDGKYEIAEFLLNHSNIDVNAYANSRKISPTIYLSKEKTALHIAALKINPKYVKLLLSHPQIDVNRKDENGLIPAEISYNWFIKQLLNQNFS